jgi:hypothetical protein
VLELLLQPRHVQAIDTPTASLALTVQYQRTQMTKDLSTSLVATHERVKVTSCRPTLYLADIDAAYANGRMHIEIHVKR